MRRGGLAGLVVLGRGEFWLLSRCVCPLPRAPFQGGERRGCLTGGAAEYLRCGRLLTFFDWWPWVFEFSCLLIDTCRRHISGTRHRYVPTTHLRHSPSIRADDTFPALAIDTCRRHIPGTLAIDIRRRHISGTPDTDIRRRHISGTRH